MDSAINGDAILNVQTNPEAIRLAQHYAQLASSGKIIGLTVVGVGPDGVVHHGHSLPSTPVFLHLAVGALNYMIVELLDAVKNMTQQAAVSRIIKPTNMIRPNG